MSKKITETDENPELFFRFEGRLAKILGRHSVSTALGAVFELVKNAYDADAEVVKIIFEDVTKDTGRIRIIDYDGTGMTKDDFENKFMVVATGSRTRETVTDSGRRVVGEKGIGRFAMESLSKKTTIISYPKGQTTGHTLEIDWKKYEEESITFDQIGNKFTPFSKEDKERAGLEVVLDEIRHGWSLKQIDKLMTQLGSLISPKGFKTKKPFKIFVSAPQLEIAETEVKSKLLTKAMFRVKSVLKDGKIKITVWERGEKVDSKDLVRNTIDPFPMNCGPVTYNYYGFPRGFGDEEREDYEKYYGMSYEGKLEEFLEDNHGIRIYKDGFRMRPYGETGNDWTERGEAARKSSGVIPNISSIGWVNLTSDDNPDIISTSTREKLIEDENFEVLRQFIKGSNAVLDSLCHKRRVAKRKKQAKDLVSQIKFIASKLNNLELSEELKPRQKVLVRDLRITAENAYEIVDEAKKEKERLMSKLEARRNLATVGLTTGLVAHEVRRDLADILSISSDFREELEGKKLSEQEIFDKTRRLYSASLFVNDYMSLVRSFTSALRSKEPEFRKKSKINLRESLEDLDEKVKPLLDRFNIKLDYAKIPKTVNDFYMFEADFQSIFVNLITNSLKAIQKQRKQTSDPEIINKTNVISLELSDDLKTSYLQIILKDDGSGVNPTIADKIFEPFVSDSSNEDEWVSGSGLGLPFVKEILESYGGMIELVESETGAQFLIKLKWEELKKK